MGTVFLAEQIAVGNRPVALKVLHRKLVDEPEFLVRFQTEAASTGRIHHPNVVTVYESGQGEDGTPYIAMEYLEGETLRQALTARGALPVAECAEVLRQAARGLHAAHKLGILHRDLKPDNIFLTRSDEGGVIVKVLDFGIAKLREFATQTLTGTVLGTPAYMSFEQASGMKSDDLDARSDIYSLGVVAYEMLTGRTPFRSDTPVGFLRMHMQEAPPPFRVVIPGLPVPTQIEAVVMKALAKDRDGRQASALEFAREFSHAASAQATSEEFKLTVKVAVPPGRMQAGQQRLAREQEEQVRHSTESAVAEHLAQTEAQSGQVARELGESKRRAMMPTPALISRSRFVLLGLVGLALIAGAIWYLSPSRSNRGLQQTQQTHAGNREDQNATDLARSFRCPEDYASIEAKQAALRDFLQGYAAKFPNNTARDAMLYRYRLLIAHSCSQTLQFMVTHVSPVTEMLRFQNRDYGPKTEEFDPTTKIWTVYYVENGDRPDLAEEELIFNFYGWEPPKSPESIADAFINRSDNVRSLWKFKAPDDLTKALGYFFLSETTYLEQLYAYANISKITSAGRSAYSVTFSKKISGTSAADVDHKVRSWVLSEECRVTTIAIGRVGVDASWQEHLTNPHSK